MEEVPILVICSCDEQHLRRRLYVPPNIASADLIKKVEAEFDCSKDIDLWEIIDDSDDVPLTDPLDLNGKPKIKAKKVNNEVSYAKYSLCNIHIGGCNW